MQINKVPGRDTTIYQKKGEVSWLEYKALNAFPWLKNAFSTREGGVSTGPYAHMNLSRTVGDDPENVLANFRILGETLQIPTDHMVLASQTHTTNVMRVGTEKMGMGVIRDRDYTDVDGIITDTPGLCLVTSYADCVPLYFVDPVRCAIGLSHSGWRGTVGNIAANTIECMNREFGTKPEDLVCCIGPCIGPECYEVSEDVAERFREAYTPAEFDTICRPEEGKEGKYMLDLPMANFRNFVNSGVKPENISLPDLCTVCNFHFLHSHRASHGKRGGMCAFLMICHED